MSALEVLQQALAGEHAAVYVYSLLGGRVSTSAEPVLSADLLAAYEVHRDRRDQLMRLVLEEGGDGTVPVAPEAGYHLPTPALSARQCRAAAKVTEQRAARSYSATVGGTMRGPRLWALEALQDAAVRALTFGGDPVAFPGIPEL